MQQHEMNRMRERRGQLYSEHIHQGRIMEVTVGLPLKSIVRAGTRQFATALWSGW